MASDAIYPGTVEWSGENPGISLKDTVDGPFVTVASFFRVVLSPHGRGHALILLAAPQQADAGTATAPNICVTDNEPLARFLVDGYARHFGTFAAAPALAHMEYRPLLGVETGGDPSGSYTETVRAPAMEIGLHWNGLGAPFALALPPESSATGQHTMVSLFAGAAEGVVTLNGAPSPAVWCHATWAAATSPRPSSPFRRPGSGSDRRPGPATAAPGRGEAAAARTRRHVLAGPRALIVAGRGTAHAPRRFPGSGISAPQPSTECADRRRRRSAHTRPAGRHGMSTSSRHPNTIRQGGPGASHENAKAPLDPKKPPPDSPLRQRSKVSGGGGERDRHHGHAPERKGGGSRPSH